ncbi:MAG: SDR family NAD(P)-dependent oxidoreductase [Acidimicrobiia bacterium]|nr:SDR family NAD(P)-dependent oxidoreductase [Acidimicrobiia bacterium]MCY4433097.1 SDR family NAD(P)-dependent oxidoreductase [bacterium]
MSSFSRESTAEEVVDGLDLSGRIFIITGTTSGLGEESARVLAGRGARVAMLARNPEANQEAAERIKSSVPDANLSTHQLDLSDLASVERFAAEAARQFDRIDVLINNAGVMCCPFGHTADGFEMQFGTNHLGHFALTVQLLPLLQQGDQPRVVTLSSGGHRISDVDLDDPNFEHTPYDPWVAYGRSKTANVHFAAELARRFGDELLSLSVHPGAIPTKLGRHMTKEMIDGMRERAKASSSSGQGLQYKTLESGAATQVWAATAPELADHNGKYLADCNVAEPGTGEIGYAPHIYNPATEAALWELSEHLVDLSV